MSSMQQVGVYGAAALGTHAGYPGMGYDQAQQNGSQVQRAAPGFTTQAAPTGGSDKGSMVWLAIIAIGLLGLRGVWEVQPSSKE